MKSLFLCIAACACIQVFAQNDSTSATGTPASIAPAGTAVSPAPTLMDAAPVSEPPKAYYPKTVIKMNVTGLPFKNYQFGLEHALTRKIAASVWYRTMPAVPLSNLSGLKKAYKLAGEAPGAVEEDWSNLTASNKTYTAEFRFYAGHKPGPRGFYIGLYGRYAQFKVDYDYAYAADAKTYAIPIATTAKGIGGGLYFGVQWLIAKHVVLDWQVLGAQLGKLTGSGSNATDLSELTAADKQAIKEDLEGKLPDASGKPIVTADVGDSGVQLNVNGPFVGLRTGISVGISF